MKARALILIVSIIALALAHAYAVAPPSQLSLVTDSTTQGN